MRHLDLFSGIGGFALAASWVWGKDYVNVGHSEIEPYPCKVYHKHFPESECLGDITKIQWREGQADLITGGFPCQPHSTNGKRLASRDERDLWYWCKDCIGLVRPRWAVFENVPGLLSSENGLFFNRVLSDLATIGYDAEWINFPAKALGFPHERQRVWIVSYPTEIRWPSSEFHQRGSLENKGLPGKHSYSVIEEMGGIPNAFVRGDIDGIPRWVDRIASLGNAIVPQVAEVILRAIKDSDSA